MNKRTVFLVLLLAGMFLVSGCEIINQLKQGVYHAASRINSIQAIGASKEFAMVDIEYVFTGTGITATKVVFGRSGSTRRDTANIVLAGTIYNDVDTLEAEKAYTYYMWLLDESGLKSYDTVEVKTLPVLEITAPSDTLTGNAITVTFKKLTYDGKDYLDYKIALYDAEGLDLFDPDPEVFLKMATPIEEKSLSITENDTQGSINLSTAPSAFLKGYVVTVSTDKPVFGPLVNKSTGVKPFFWMNVK